MSDNKISLTDIKHVAQLANLTVTDAQASQFQTELSAVVDHFEALSQVDVINVIPTAQVTGLENITRKDQVGVRTLDQDQALSMTPNKHNGYIQVPSILANRAED